MVEFSTALDWQQQWQKQLLDQTSIKQAVWLLEHQACYTLGKGANLSNILFDPSDPPYKVHRINRGGDITHHVEGQLVGYLVLDLSRYQKDLDWYLRKLEQVLLDVLEKLGLQGQRLEGMTGVWIEGVKVGSIGIGCRRWITLHGFSLNVDCDSKGFESIIPCGIKNCAVGSLDDWIPGLRVVDVKPLIKKALAEHFSLEWEIKNT